MADLNTYANATPVLTDEAVGNDDPGGSWTVKTFTFAAIRTLLEANLVQPIITVAAANTAALVSTGYSLTGSDATSMIDLAGTWNTTGTPTALKLDVTDTASNAASLLLDLQAGGVSKFFIEKDGGINTAAGVVKSVGTILTLQNDSSAQYIRIFTTRLEFRVGSSNLAAISKVPDELRVRQTTAIGWNDNSSAQTVVAETKLYRDAAYTIGQRNDTNPQAFNIYNTWTDASNYERLSLKWNTNVFQIASEALGTGTLRQVEFTEGFAITPATANTSALTSTGYSLTGSDATSMIDLAGTWNTTGTPTAIKLDVTDTASNAASLLLDLQVDSASMFKVEKDGTIWSNSRGVLKAASNFITEILVNNNVSVQVRSNGLIQASVAYTLAAGVGTPDVYLARDAAGTFAQRNGTNAQAFNIYSTFTDASNYERLEFDWITTSNVCEIKTTSAGTGTDRAMVITSLSGQMAPGANAGTPGTGTTAVEHGDGRNFVTVLTMAGVLPAIAGGAALAVGLLVYTFPAGVTRVKSVHMDVGIDGNETNIDADTPEVGVGSVIATGAVAVLNGTTGFDDYVTETTAANCTGTTTDFSFDTVDAGLTLNDAAGTKTMHLNAADNWAASGDTAAALSGTITIEWTFLGS